MFPPKYKLNLKTIPFHLEKLTIEEGLSIVESWLDVDPIMIGGYWKERKFKRRNEKIKVVELASKGELILIAEFPQKEGLLHFLLIP